MIQITFKNVDQGDSIILEWSNDEKDCIAIIDCNLDDDKNNSVLDHLIKKDYKEIEFIILSHPHYDHYSGFEELLTYCYDNGVIIGHFIHTCSQASDYIRAALDTAEAKGKLIDIFKLVRKHRDDRGLNDGAVIASPFLNIPLVNSANIKILSPTSIERDKFLKKEAYFDEENPHNNPNGNWLSTVIKLELSDKYILLTSDAEKHSLYRIDKKTSSLNDSTLILAQAPHHGSKYNHKSAFWKIQNEKKVNIPIVFSVGNNSHGHVHKEVANDLRNLGYSIYSTNPEGALKVVQSTNTLSSKLNQYSRPVKKTGSIDPDLNGDQVFRINFDGEIVD